MIFLSKNNGAENEFPQISKKFSIPLFFFVWYVKGLILRVKYLSYKFCKNTITTKPKP